MKIMRRNVIAIATLLCMALPAAAYAQFSDSYNFLKAVKDRDGAETMKYINKPGSNIIDTQDSTSGESALHIVTRNRDTTWLGFLLGKGAKPNLRNSKGETPLIIAAQLGFLDGADLLLKFHASVDLADKDGETPLIIATERDDVPLVHLLLHAGADPDKPDFIAGTSARTYAQRFTRDPALAEAFKDIKPGAHRQMQGPSL
ncbi:MAG: ankyrin repeat domain-containing protein [Alphaproteobacteria bacterium]|nr:ankyrin repeat domain-containing protein [Alphaproteobacteria bacterium]MDE2042033.1 ankyrin repeat domain-containing protein [Alphaproteobacteria bacterium]MDE2340973.1 ankyrin repeat domain-containing protein [Alphaproteobacteria bacterium]